VLAWRHCRTSGAAAAGAVRGLRRASIFVPTVSFAVLAFFRTITFYFDFLFGLC